MSKLSHLDEHGAARMVDISQKNVTEREAVAEAQIVLSPEAFTAVASGDAPKGDVLAAARIAGIMAAKKTSELIPLCHPIALSKANIDFEMLEDKSAIRIVATTRTSGQTGVEMEALTAASIAALTIYDMVKSVDKSAVIETVRLLSKSGGKSGSFVAESPQQRPSARRIAVAPARSNAQSRARPATLMGEVAAAAPRQDANAQREAFRAFMISNHLRATQWAKEAGIPAAQIYSYLTGRSSALSRDVAEKLARAARVRVEDLFR